MVSPSSSHLLAGENYVNGRFEDSVRAHVGGTDHQAIDAVARADDGIAGEPDARGGARELREHEAGHQREREQTGERLDRNEDVREEGDRLHLAVADGRHGLHAEEEHVHEIVRPNVLDALIEVVAGGEDEIGEGERKRDPGDEAGPRGRNEAVIEVLECAGRHAANRIVTLQTAELLRSSLRHREGI